MSLRVTIRIQIISNLTNDNQSILKKVNPEHSLEGLMLKLKLQYFGHLIRSANSLEKDPDAGKDWGQKREAKDESVGWCHRLNGHEFEQALGAGEGQGSLVCCNPWGHRFRHNLVTEQQQQYFLVQSCSCNFTTMISLTTLHVGCQFPNQGWNLHALQ